MASSRVAGLTSTYNVSTGSATIKSSKTLFAHGPSSLMRLGLAIVLSIGMMVADYKGEHLERLRGVMSTLVAPIHYAVSLPIAFGDWLAGAATSRTRLMADNDRLREELLLAQARTDRIAALEGENQRLRQLMESTKKSNDRVLIAELLSIDMDPYSRRVVLNKGTRDGVMPGQSLVDSKGIMGQVTHAGPISSNALLITDPSHALPVQVTRSGVRAVAVGTGNSDELKLTYVPNNADLEQGDTLVSSGLGGRFPEGYPVGEVVSIERRNGRPFAEVLVKASARLERNREVLVVWPSRPDRAIDTALAPAFGGDPSQSLLDGFDGTPVGSLEIVQ